MPETIARIITDSVGPAWARDWTRGDLHLLHRVAAAHPAWRVTSMPEDFETVPDAAAQITAALAIWCPGAGVPAGQVIATAPEGFAADLPSIAGLIDGLGVNIGWRHGMDWKRDRLNSGARAALNARAPYPALDSKAQYNRHVRVLRNLWDKAVRMQARQEFRRLVLTGRSGFACDIPLKRFTADPYAAAFTAYITARKNKRRQFTLAGLENPVDEVAAMLLGKCERAFSTDWAMIAEVWPAPGVLARLGDEDTGSLMARWWTVMRDCSVKLAAEWPADADRAAMTVRRGHDSSGWNTLASAYNAARSAWLNCAAGAGAAAVTGPFCPGKVMRLMAADLARWHQMSGGGVHPDTAVWAALPFPWDVINGLAGCTAGDVAQACAAAGVNPVASGWTAPRAARAGAVFRPTPDLVHGVEVASPEWAGLLRRAGVFSGGKVRAGDEGLRAAAEEAGMIAGELPAYRDGQYAGTTHHPITE